MVSRDEVHGSGYGKHRFILEKTDPNDSRWLASLLRHGLVQGSFIPPRDIQELRDLTRRRRTLVGEGSSERNRVQKILEDANVKLGNVLSDVFVTSVQAMLEALLENKWSPAEIAELAHWSLAPKIPQIVEALEGHRMSEHLERSCWLKSGTIQRSG
jgi:transposase